MLESDEVRLRHMLEAAHEAVAFARGRVRGDLETDRQLALALIKNVEIVGEAAARITDETRSRAPDIPWQRIVAMRNRLVHAYFTVDLESVWETVRKNLPPLIEILEGLLAPESDDG